MFPIYFPDHWIIEAKKTFRLPCALPNYRAHRRPLGHKHFGTRGDRWYARKKNLHINRCHNKRLTISLWGMESLQADLRRIWVKKVSEILLPIWIPLELSTKWSEPQWRLESAPRSGRTSTVIWTSIISISLPQQVSHWCPNVSHVHMVHIWTLMWHLLGQWNREYRPKWVCSCADFEAPIRGASAAATTWWIVLIESKWKPKFL